MEMAWSGVGVCGRRGWEEGGGGEGGGGGVGQEEGREGGMEGGGDGERWGGGRGDISLPLIRLAPFSQTLYPHST